MESWRVFVLGMTGMIVALVVLAIAGPVVRFLVLRPMLAWVRRWKRARRFLT